MIRFCLRAPKMFGETMSLDGYRILDKDNLPMWAQAAIDQRLAGLRAEIELADSEDAVLITTLTNPPKGATQEQIDVWEKNCDNCHRHYPDITKLLLCGVRIANEDGDMIAGIAFGSCKECSEMP